MSNAQEEMKIYDKIREAERGHIAFLCTCLLLLIIPCLFPDFLDRLFARTKLTEYSDILTGAFPIMAIAIAIIHCKSHKKARETLLREKRQLENKTEMTKS